MTGNELLDQLVDREDMVGYSYSLYECLADLITDVEAMTDATLEDQDGLMERITISAMNCLADIEHLMPPFEQLVRYRFESTVS